MSSARFIDSFYACRDYIAGQTIAYYVVENNSLQDPIYEQVYLPLINKKNENNPLPITPDAEKKGEKWARIEADLEPINRLCQLIFNIDEEKNEHMKRLEAQFKAAKPTSKQLDGPDCIQGAKHIIDNKEVIYTEHSVYFQERKESGETFY